MNTSHQGLSNKCVPKHYISKGHSYLLTFQSYFDLDGIKVRIYMKTVISILSLALVGLNGFPLAFLSLMERNILQMSSNISAIACSLAAAYITAEGTYPTRANVFTSYHTALTGSDVCHPAKICDLFTRVIKSWILFVFSFPSMLFNRFFSSHLLGIKVIPVKYD